MSKKPKNGLDDVFNSAMVDIELDIIDQGICRQFFTLVARGLACDHILQSPHRLKNNLQVKSHTKHAFTK